MKNQTNETQHYDPVKRHNAYLRRKDKIRQESRRWNDAHPDRKRANTKANRIKRRLKCIDAYGGKCMCCGNNIYEFMTIDHVNGGGSKHIKSLGGNGTGFYSWLIQNKFPNGYQTLCYNCNCAKSSYGMCPHVGRIHRPIDRHRRRRIFCINYYGGKCACCGESTIEFLTIDHPLKDGAAHRKITGSGSSFYSWLQRNNYPSGFRVLCRNCNSADGLYGRCPHESWK